MERNATEILKQVKEFFNSLVAPAPAPPAPAPVALMTEYTLVDGVTKVSIDNLAAGGKVVIKNADGTETVAPAGEHTLQDGTVIVVAEGGLISEVRAVQVQAAAPVFQSMKEMLEHDFAGSIEERIGALETMVKGLIHNCMGYEIREAAAQEAIVAYKTSIEGMELEMKEQKENSAKIIGGLIEAVELVSKEPTAKPDESIPAKTKFAETKKVDLSGIKNILFSKQ